MQERAIPNCNDTTVHVGTQNETDTKKQMGNMFRQAHYLVREDYTPYYENIKRKGVQIMWLVLLGAMVFSSAVVMLI